MKRTLKRELKVRETVGRETNVFSNAPFEIQPACGAGPGFASCLGMLKLFSRTVSCVDYTSQAKHGQCSNMDRHLGTVFNGRSTVLFPGVGHLMIFTQPGAENILQSYRKRVKIKIVYASNPGHLLHISYPCPRHQRGLVGENGNF